MKTDLIAVDIHSIIQKILHQKEQVIAKKSRHIAPRTWEYTIRITFQSHMQNNSETFYELTFELWESHPWNVVFLGMNTPYQYPMQRNVVKRDLTNCLHKKRTMLVSKNVDVDTTRNHS